MTKGIVLLKISCGLLAAVALIVGCTTEDGVVDVSACATDGVAELPQCAMTLGCQFH
jgi:hypothetical protein